jgi:hypothetical protein
MLGPREGWDVGIAGAWSPTDRTADPHRAKMDLSGATRLRHVRTQKRTHTSAPHTHTQMHAQAQTHTPVDADPRIRTCARTHTRTRTHTHTHTRTYLLFVFSFTIIGGQPAKNLFDIYTYIRKRILVFKSYNWPSVSGEEGPPKDWPSRFGRERRTTAAASPHASACGKDHKSRPNGAHHAPFTEWACDCTIRVRNGVTCLLQAALG